MIHKLATAWSGTSGGPGITQLYIQSISFPGAPITAGSAQTAVNAMRSFWDSVKAYLPDEVSLTVQPVMDAYDEGNGDLVNTVSAATPPAVVTGTSATAYSMAAGMKMNLVTADIVNGRRVRGAVYLVPATTAAMSTSGNILAAARTAVNSAGTTLLGALALADMQLVVFRRPLKDSGGTITRVGGTSDVTAIETNEKSAILRGRRD